MGNVRLLHKMRKRNMKRILTIIAVIAFTLSAAAQSEQLKITIFGDSYSTFAGYLSCDSNLTWYYPADHPWFNKMTDVTKVEETWWYIHHRWRRKGIIALRPHQAHIKGASR